jgi:hypothetical protein
MTQEIEQLKVTLPPLLCRLLEAMESLVVTQSDRPPTSADTGHAPLAEWWDSAAKKGYKNCGTAAKPSWKALSL